MHGNLPPNVPNSATLLESGHRRNLRLSHWE